MICQNCIHSEVCKHKSESVYECEHFKDGTIKNQYDRIRNMGVDELAKFIHKIAERTETCEYCPIDDFCTERVTRLGCTPAMFMEWLESEVME